MYFLLKKQDIFFLINAMIFSKTYMKYFLTAQMLIYVHQKKLHCVNHIKN